MYGLRLLAVYTQQSGAGSIRQLRATPQNFSHRLGTYPLDHPPHSPHVLREGQKRAAGPCYDNLWHPADAATWEWFAGRGSAAPSAIGGLDLASEEGPTWFTRLRMARERSGLTRPQLAELAQISPHTLYA